MTQCRSTPWSTLKGIDRARRVSDVPFEAIADSVFVHNHPSSIRVVFTRAVAAGAVVREPLADAFWGDRHGQLEDPFGHRWNVDQHLHDVPHSEVVAAAARAFA